MNIRTTFQENQKIFIDTFMDYFAKVDMANMLEATGRITATQSRFKRFLTYLRTTSLDTPYAVIKEGLMGAAVVGATGGLMLIPGAQLIAPVVGLAAGVGVKVSTQFLEDLAKKLEGFTLQYAQTAAEDIAAQFGKSSATEVAPNISTAAQVQQVRTQLARGTHVTNILLSTLSSRRQAASNFKKLLGMGKTQRELVLRYSLEKLSLVYEQAINSLDKEALQEFAMCAVERLLSFLYYFGLPFAPPYIMAGVLLGYSGRDFFHSPASRNTRVSTTALGSFREQPLTVEGMLYRSPIIKEGKIYLLKQNFIDRLSQLKALQQNAATHMTSQGLPKYVVRQYLGEAIEHYTELSFTHQEQAFQQFCQEFKAHQLTYSINSETFMTYVEARHAQQFQGSLNEFVGALVHSFWQKQARQPHDRLQVDIDAHLQAIKRERDWLHRLETGDKAIVQTQVLNIEKAHLARIGKNLADCDLGDCIFELCDFSEVNFKDVVLNHTRFYHCKLKKAKLNNLTVQDAHFAFCDLSGLELEQATLLRVLFNQVNLEGAKLSTAHLIATPLTEEHAQLDREYLQSGKVYLNTRLLSHSPFIVRKGQSLEDLHEKLQAKLIKEHKALILMGPRYTGKKRQEAEFYERFKPEYQFAFWLDASSKTMLQWSLKQLANKLDIQVTAAREGQWQKDLYQKLNAYRKWLLVFADVKDLTLIERVIKTFPQSEQGHILLTSHKVDLTHAPDYLVNRLNDFEENEARDFLVKNLQLQPAAIDTLLSLSGYHPQEEPTHWRYSPLVLERLCLQLKSEAQPEQLLATLKQELEGQDRLEKRLLPLVVLHRLQLDKIKQNDNGPNTLALLHHLALLGDYPIPYPLLQTIAQTVWGQKDIKLDALLIQLEKNHLLDIDEKGHITLAPELATWLNHVKTNREERYSRLCQSLLRAAKLQNFAVGANEANAALIEHGESLVKRILKTGQENPLSAELASHTIRLMNFMGQHYTQTGEIALAQAQFEHAYQLLVKLVPQHTNTMEQLYHALRDLAPPLPLHMALVYNLFWRGRLCFYGAAKPEDFQPLLEKARDLAKLIQQETQQIFVPAVNIDCKGLLYFLVESEKVEDWQAAVERYTAWTEDFWTGKTFINEHNEIVTFDITYHLLGCYSQLVKLYNKLGDYNLAKAACDKLFAELSQRPQEYRRSNDYFNRRAETYLGLGQLDKAEQDLQVAISYPSLYPEYPQADAYFALAQMYQAKHQVKRALWAIEQCLTLRELLYPKDDKRLQAAQAFKRQLEQLQQPAVQVLAPMMTQIQQLDAKLSQLKQEQDQLKTDVQTLREDMNHKLDAILALLRPSVEQPSREHVSTTGGPTKTLSTLFQFGI